MTARDRLDLLRGTFGFVLLQAVSTRAKHGYEIMRWLRDVTDEEFLVGEGVLYPALHRLEAGGLVRATWAVTEANRQAKYYRITPKGRRELDRQLATWHRYVATVDKVIEACT